MRKVGFFRSIHLKTVLIYMLLILIAMQVIGVYFVRQLETTLKDNFKTSIQDKVNILAYYLEEQLTMDRLPQEDESYFRRRHSKIITMTIIQQIY